MLSMPPVEAEASGSWSKIHGGDSRTTASCLFRAVLPGWLSGIERGGAVACRWICRRFRKGVDVDVYEGGNRCVGGFHAVRSGLAGVSL